MTRKPNINSTKKYGPSIEIIESTAGTQNWNLKLSKFNY